MERHRDIFVVDFGNRMKGCNFMNFCISPDDGDADIVLTDVTNTLMKVSV